ncbi:MAG: hypothetical protein E7166_04955 [Firmicutes bacterium]|nr:hypothetical protein [Bacillota bacterium]
MQEKICGYYLDREQEAIVLDESKHLLVVAGAGSGKTLTILGKINYLLKYKNINKNEILCISFTKAAAHSLKEKIKDEFNLDLPVYTFHKLSLEILNDYSVNYDITQSDTLNNIIHKFIYIDVLENSKFMSLILKYFNIKYKNKKQYINFLYNNKFLIENYKRLILTFIKLLKCNNYELENFTDFLKIAKKNIFTFKKEKIFLVISLNIYLIYTKYLEDNNEIDFDDMLIIATKLIEENGTDRKYKYIIIDEYQDTSYIRFRLIERLLKFTSSNLLVVGDDFQSIYRFTGCDLSLFVNFNLFLKDSKIMKIQNTYRNSQELISIAGNFVMKNKIQIVKDLKSEKHLNNPIQIIYYTNIKETFLKLILNLYQKLKSSIMVLGRNNNDIDLILDKRYFKYNNDKIIFLDNPDIEIKYLTVHKSKGLEEENVVIINLENKLLGFPNQIVDSKVLRFVSYISDKYPYSEERRLFYVALTRTKNYVFLLVPKYNESIFVKEIRKNYKNKIKIYKC